TWSRHLVAAPPDLVIVQAFLSKRQRRGHVRFWHKADIPRVSFNVRFWHKADISHFAAAGQPDPLRCLAWVVTCLIRFGDQKVRTQMTMLIKTLAAVAAGTVLATNAFAQSTREVRDVSPYVAIENESPPKLIVDPTPLAAGLAHDIVWIQYHAENVRIVPVF